VSAPIGCHWNTVLLLAVVAVGSKLDTVISLLAWRSHCATTIPGRTPAGAASVVFGASVVVVGSVVVLVGAPEVPDEQPASSTPATTAVVHRMM
jgi:hypothetical protein